MTEPILSVTYKDAMAFIEENCSDAIYNAIASERTALLAANARLKNAINDNWLDTQDDDDDYCNFCYEKTCVRLEDRMKQDLEFPHSADCIVNESGG